MSKKCKTTMPYKVGRKTKTKGWPIMQRDIDTGLWRVIAHSKTKANAEASIRARYYAKWLKK